MSQESGQRGQTRQQPQGQQSHNPRQQSPQMGGGRTYPQPPYGQKPLPPKEGECNEPDPEPQPEPCPPLPEPPDLCETICYGPPEWGDDPCEDLCREPEENQAWWKFPCKGLLNIECKEPDDCNGKQGSIPCNPCDDLIDQPEDGNGGIQCLDPCEVGPPDVCDAAGLKAKLDELKKCISGQVSLKASLDEAIKAAGVQQQELEKLVGAFTETLDKYKKARPALLSREDSLRGFFQTTKAAIETNLSPDLRVALTKAINCEYCKLRKMECCKQRLEGELNCIVDLLEEKKQAKQEEEKAEQAYKNIKDLGGLIDSRFKELEQIQKTIVEAQDNKNYRLMFYLFYWEFVPKFCNKYEPEICCSETESERNQQPSSTEAVCIGKDPGDWHPSQIEVEKLKKLLCCAWAFVGKKKADYQKKAAEISAIESQLKFINERYKLDKDNRDKTIRAILDSVDKNYMCVPNRAPDQQVH